MKALMAALMRVFEKKSFGGQEQYINKQTGQIADCNQMKVFLQQEMNSQNYLNSKLPYYLNSYNYQTDYRNYG